MTDEALNGGASQPGRPGTGRLSGFRQWEGGIDPFEDHTGPFYFREIDDTGYVCAFEVARQHLNGHGAIHGGCLMTFADYALFVFARPAMIGQSGVTVSFSSEFLAPAFEGDLVLGHGEIVRETGSMVFLRGLISADRGGHAELISLLSFSGIIKKIRSRP